jgi:hypothetical protein
MLSVGIKIGMDLQQLAALVAYAARKFYSLGGHPK